MRCPFCEKDTANMICDYCGGDIHWAQENNFDVANKQRNFAPNPRSNPALQEFELKQFLNGTDMPNWLKERIIQDHNHQKRRTAKT